MSSHLFYCRHNRNVILSIKHLTGGVAVEGKVVDGARGNAADLALLSEGLDSGSESSGRLLALKRQEIGAEASNMRGGHASTRDGVLNMSARFKGAGLSEEHTVPPLFQVDRMDTPGAKTSTTEP